MPNVQPRDNPYIDKKQAQENIPPANSKKPPIKNKRDEVLPISMDELIAQNVNIQPSTISQNKTQLKTAGQKGDVGGQIPNEKRNVFFDRVKKYVYKEDELCGIFKEREDLGWDLKF